MKPASRPRETLSILDAVAIIVGMVVGVGIFKTPSIVASAAGSEGMLILFWLAGGAASLIGALCYAELTSTHPNAGGDYHYLHKALGKTPSFLYAWARITVIQTGSIAMVAFIIGDYATELFSLGPYSSALYAGLAIAVLTGVNIAGIRQGKWTQKVLIAAVLGGLCIVAAAGLFLNDAGAGEASGSVIPGHAALGTAMIFVLLTYGGWNEASFISAEVRSSSRNMVRVLLYSIAAITLIYLLVNLALMTSLGLQGMAGSDAVMADLAGRAFGDMGARLISLLILLAAISTANAAIITGARTSYALGTDYGILKFLGAWQGGRETPVNALLLQAAIALLLVLLGGAARGGFVMMVEYTAPVFWFFLLLVGLSLFVMRYRYPGIHRPFSVPLYPLTPALFCAVCLFMLHASLAYTGKGALVGLGVLLTGIPLLLLQRKPSARTGETNP